jgi:hypothetical protein
MESTAIRMVNVNSVQAILEGGPVTIPDTSRIQVVSPFDEKVKLPHYGGYEHFERTVSFVEDTSCQQIIYRWTTRTELAE